MRYHPTAHINSLVFGRICLALFFCWALPQAVNADWALDASAELDFLDVYPDQGTGFVDFSPVAQGVQADFGFGNSIPSNFEYQDWDGSAWPEEFFSKEVDSPDGFANASAYIENKSAEEEDVRLPFYMAGSVGGQFQGGLNMAGSAVYDFTLIVDPNTVAAVELTDIYADIDASTGTEGFGFAGAKIYDPIADVDDFGGANNPFDEQFVFAEAGDVVGETLALFADFDNLNGSEEMFVDLTIEVYAVLFTTAVPEPGSLVLLGLIGITVVARRRR